MKLMSKSMKVMSKSLGLMSKSLRLMSKIPTFINIEPQAVSSIITIRNIMANVIVKQVNKTGVLVMYCTKTLT